METVETRPSHILHRICWQAFCTGTLTQAGQLVSNAASADRLLMSKVSTGFVLLCGVDLVMGVVRRHISLCFMS